MGNQLVGIAPSQIYPVEHYFLGTFGSEIEFESNMGSTRFFKVAKAKCDEGLIVVKVFVKHDPTLPLEDHKKRVDHIKKALANSVNCLPFQRVEITERAAYIMREFVKHSLYDRVSTRPFLTTLEKKWITFQILCALNQCHKQKICHGDIKLENILITSWNWVLLSDFASFKPTYLPEDNPADYTYFFDTSRRRTCYIAPERFVKTMSSDDAEGNVTESMLPTDSLVRLGSYYSGNTLLPAMDIFSAGCALLELWTEGTAPFELSQLLAYRRGERELVEKHLHGIENDNLRNLLASMINLNSINRRSAEDYLDQERGRLFPEYFYSFLQSYLQMFSSLPIMTPDDKIIRLHSDITHCIKVLTNQPLRDHSDGDDCEKKANTESDANPPSDQDGLILIITVVTSCIRGLQYSNSKICSLEILYKLSQHTTSETILDRILPYILHLAQTSPAKVQAQALETLTSCLGLVKEIPRSDANVFPEYILKSIAPLSGEEAAVLVRVACARNISKLAKIAIYFFEETQRNTPSEMPFRRYQAELNALHEIIQKTVLNLLIDSEPIVKQTLMESGICDLCAFFGKEKANDVVLSHITTFLNDDDKNLRGAFYDNISGVAGYVGWQASDILVPLLLQGFSDREEFVVAKAIRAVTVLIELGHIRKPAVIEIIAESACYLCHPNLWIRHEIVGMISTTAKILHDIDVQCKIMPIIEKFLHQPIIQVEIPELLLDSLLPPVPRNLYDMVLRSPDIQCFMNMLEERARVRQSTPQGMLPHYEELFRRLFTEGMDDQIEELFYEMKSLMLKVKYKHVEPDELSQNGKIVIDRQRVQCHDYPLVDKPIKLERRKGDPNMNLEWQHIYNDGHATAITSPSGDLAASPTLASSPPLGGPLPPAVSLGEYTIPDRNFWTDRVSECRQDLERLRNKIKVHYASHIYSRDKNISQYPSGWRMSGNIVAHMYEHRGAVLKMTSLKPNGSVFASASTDGTVRLWDCNKLYGHQGINKSRQVYSANTPIYSLAACDAGQSLAIGGKDGSLLIMRIDRNSSKMTLQQALHLDETEHSDGPVVDMHAYSQSSQSVIIYATLYGAIVAWDTRMQTSVWRLQNELRHGVITSICSDATGSWLAAATSGGRHMCWDLRFHLPIADIKHPSDGWIRKVACHPTLPSCLISSTKSNNEVSIWDVETGHRKTVLWASSAPVLSHASNNESATTCAILPGVIDGSPFILTGSSDQRIRYWDLMEPKNSSLVVPSAKDNLSDISFTYNSRLIEGSQVIEENIVSLGTGDLGSLRCSTEENPRSGPEMPSHSHHDGITDLLMCRTDKQQIIIVSSSRDGVIKLWK